MLWLFVLAIAMPITLAEKTNLAKTTWEHAVNNNTRLVSALGGDARMFEADVSIGILKTVPVVIPGQPPAPAPAPDQTTPQIPIMSHNEPESDLSLDAFLTTVSTYNGVKDNENKTRGAKLDFKTIEAVEQSVDILKAKLKDLKAPLWINADILEGPGGPKSTPVDAKKFFEAVSAKELEETTLSIGWTTGDKVETYTKEQVDAMIKVIVDNKIHESKHPITFPVRAAHAAESKDTLKQLYDEVSKKNKQVTFTLWTTENDTINKDNLQKFINSFGAEKIYADLPKDVKDNYKWDTSGASSIVKFGIFNVAAILIALFFRNAFH